MASKKISELSVKIPVAADVLAVADPSTGIAGKSTAAQATYAGMNQSSVIPTNSSFAFQSTSASLTGNTNNLVIGSETLVRISSSANYDLTGIVPLASAANNSGRLMYLVNVGSNTITLKPEDALSTAANRFITHNGNNLSLPAGHVAICIYDGVASRWRVWSVV